MKRGLRRLLAVAPAVGNSSCNPIIIAIFGAIKSSIFPPYGLHLLSHTCLAFNIHHRPGEKGRDLEAERERDREDKADPD